MKFKNIYIYLILTLIILSYSPICKAQSTEKNLLKYWYYRDRLKTDFMSCVCNENGGSMPASIRNNQANPANLYWGDATINLAYYIGTLALEHFMLNSNGENTDETDRELFYAINAILVKK